MLLPRKYESADNRRPRRTHRMQQRNFFWKSYLQFFNLFTCIWSFGKSEQRKSDKKLWWIWRKRFEIGSLRAIQLNIPCLHKMPMKESIPNAMISTILVNHIWVQYFSVQIQILLYMLQCSVIILQLGPVDQELHKRRQNLIILLVFY